MRRGSSPATRGGLLPQRLAARDPGLIPGYAGRTRSIREPGGRRWAHPRLRGEDAYQASLWTEAQGSSPATRGGHVTHGKPCVSRGLIPGYAGRTGGTSPPCPRTGAHPRLRGEDPCIRGNAVTSPGSSPATRGGRDDAEPVVVGGGSSPATRGGPQAAAELHHGPGLIPGYAGRTRCSRWLSARCWAHPRLRGEDGNRMGKAITQGGSSPATRGGLVLDGPVGVSDGLIPGYAGRTNAPPSSQWPSWAHPRLRGEDP